MLEVYNVTFALQAINMLAATTNTVVGPRGGMSGVVCPASRMIRFRLLTANDTLLQEEDQFKD